MAKINFNAFLPHRYGTKNTIVNKTQSLHANLLKFRHKHVSPSCLLATLLRYLEGNSRLASNLLGFPPKLQYLGVADGRGRDPLEDKVNSRDSLKVTVIPVSALPGFWTTNHYPT